MFARPTHHRVFARCGVLLVVALFALIAYGCKSKKNAAVLATLTEAKGPVERQANAQSTWDAAPTGTRFVFGDAARTADSEAKFTLARGAQLALAPRSVLRFGGAATRPFALELGSVELGGDGAYDLGFGTLDLRRNGRVRISAQGGATAVELLLGEVALLREGQTVMLQAGQPLSLELGALVLTQPDARPSESLDAAATLTLGEVQLEVTGEGTQWQPPGATAWAAVPAGRTALVAGTALRVGQGGKAVVAYAGQMLELAGGARMSLTVDKALVLQLGTATASVTAGTKGTVQVPGGAAVLHGEKGPAAARLDVDGRETKAAQLRGEVELVASSDGSVLPLARGDSGALSRTGQLRIIDSIPSYFDVSVTAGESVQIHDPKGATAIRFQFGSKCAAAGEIEMDRDTRFRTVRISAGSGAANLLVSRGSWAYRLRCAGKIAAQGRIAVVGDTGARQLTKTTPTNAVDADGRTYQITYQSQLPNLVVRWPNATGNSFTLYFAQGGKSQSFPSNTSSVKLPGKLLKEGQYTYWFEKSGVKSKVSTLVLDFDQAAAQIYIESPANAKPFGPTIDARGAVLDGWNVATVEGVALKLDRARRFSAQIPPPSNGVLALRFSHAQLGTHYYLRREN